jgi:hypothetical protein
MAMGHTPLHPLALERPAKQRFDTGFTPRSVNIDKTGLVDHRLIFLPKFVSL